MVEKSLVEACYGQMTRHCLIIILRLQGGGRLERITKLSLEFGHLSLEGSHLTLELGVVVLEAVIHPKECIY